jgi:hypothetical protein
LNVIYSFKRGHECFSTRDVELCEAKEDGENSATNHSGCITSNGLIVKDNEMPSYSVAILVEHREQSKRSRFQRNSRLTYMYMNSLEIIYGLEQKG